MSLINQMLRDLEQRRALAPGRRERLPGNLHVPRGPEPSTPWRLPGVLVLAAAAVAGFLALRPGTDAASDGQGTAVSEPAPFEAVLETPPAPSHLAGDVPGEGEATVPQPSSPRDAEIVQDLLPAPAAAADAVRTALAERGEDGVAPDRPGEARLPEPVRPEAAQSAASAGRSTVGDGAGAAASRAQTDITRPPAPDTPAAIPETAPPQRAARVEKKLREPTAAERAEAHYFEGVERLRAGERDAAAAHWREALALEAGHLLAREALAGLLIAQGRGDEAGALLEDGLRIAPDHALFAKLRARLLAEQGDVPGALAVLERHRRAGAADAEYHALAAALYQRAQLHSEAVAAYRQALVLRPGESIWRMGLAISLEGVGRNDEALAAYRDALAEGRLAPELARYVEGRIAALKP